MVKENYLKNKNFIKRLINKTSNFLNLNRKLFSLNILLFLISFINEVENNVFLSEIKLVVLGNISNQILSNQFSENPSEVYVNGIKKTSCTKTCDLENDINNVTIIFNKTITSCEKMFEGLANIKEMDLSNFNTSEVNSMEYMFHICLNMEKIIFGNISTSKVQKMNHLFKNC